MFKNKLLIRAIQQIQLLIMSIICLEIENLQI